MINYARHRRAIERMYDALATISRHVEVEKPSGETTLELQPVFSDQRCHLSQSGLAKNNQTEAQNEIQYEIKLFIAPELDIRQGDVIDVTRAGVTRTYTAGEPFSYPTHQEISLQRKVYA